MSKTRLMTAVTLGVTALVLSGCGSATPGVAATVGDEQLTVRAIDTATSHYCTAISDQLKAEGPYPMGTVKQYVVRVLALRSQTMQIADDYGVEPGSTYRNAVAQLQGTLATMPEEVRDDYLEVESTSALANDIVTQVGAIVLDDSGASDPTSDQVTQAGVDVFNQWPDVHGIEVDPRFGLKAVDGSITSVDTSTSVAVGTTATDGLAGTAGSEFVRSLPSTQRCG